MTDGNQSQGSSGEEQAPPTPKEAPNAQQVTEPVEPDLSPIKGVPTTAAEDLPEGSITEPDLGPIKGDFSTRLGVPAPSTPPDSPDAGSDNSD